MVPPHRSRRRFYEGSLIASSAAGGVRGTFLWFVKSSDIAKELLHHGDVVAAGGGFVADFGDFDGIGFDVLDILDDSVVIKGNDDDFFIDDFGIEDAAFFRFFADIVPDFVIKGCLRRGGTQGFQDVGAGGYAGRHLGDAEILNDIAARGLSRSAGRQAENNGKNLEEGLHIV